MVRHAGARLMLLAAFPQSNLRRSVWTKGGNAPVCALSLPRPQSPAIHKDTYCLVIHELIKAGISKVRVVRGRTVSVPVWRWPAVAHR